MARKGEKDREKKKRQIEDYKRQKLEAEEMLANADIDLDDYEDDQEYDAAQIQPGQYNQVAGGNYQALGPHNAGYPYGASGASAVPGHQGGKPPKAVPEDD